MDTTDNRFEELLERLGNVEAVLRALVQQRTVKDWYTTDEIAGILGKAEFTVREWCRLGRIRAEKKKSGRVPSRLGLSAMTSSCVINGTGSYASRRRCGMIGPASSRTSM